MSRYNSFYIPATMDSDALAFFSAAGITDSTQKAAVDTMVKSLKSNNLWTKLRAIYPFVGGTATTHKFNLKDPRDLDAAFRLTFSGGWVHSSTGAKPNGSNGYASTNYVPNSQNTLNNASLNWYTRDNLYRGIGNFSTGMIHLTEYSGTIYSGLHCGQSSYYTTISTGLYSISRILSTEYKVYRNGSSIATVAASSSSMTTTPLYLGARYEGGSANWHTTNELAFASIGDGLNSTEETNLYTIVQAYNTSLSRQV